MKRVILAILVLAFIVAAFTIRWQDPSCSPETQGKLADIAKSLENRLSFETSYISTPDCEDGFSLTATLVSPGEAAVDLSERLRDICKSTTGEDMICVINGEEFELSADSLSAGTQVEIGLIMDQ